ncbi:MAG TPA: hypothetical protein VMF61_04970 [Candidatus Acidoferrales bacterium]|nr:hypothetical protein [Candidatus Acidoferrales bacterium]
MNWLLSPVPQQNRLWLTIGLLVTIAMIAGSVVLLVADAVAGAIHGALSKDGRDGRKIKRGH